jgi:glucose-6-phosphate isomerase, archaeal
MIDLCKQSGLHLQWDPSKKRLVFGEGMSNIDAQPDIRRRGDMIEVLYDDQAVELEDLYYMYRGVSLSGDEALIHNKGLRYDVTVISPGTLGREFVKTAGHYHPEKPGTGITYPEVYEVLHGRAHYLLQQPHPGSPEDLETVIFIAAKPGDKILIPPQFGHITINPGDDYLIMSNWVAREFSSVYEPILKMGGGAYFELRSDDGPDFIANKKYRSMPQLQRCPVTPVPQLNLITGLPLYRVFNENSDAFGFLSEPENYRDIFDNYLKELTSD